MSGSELNWSGRGKGYFAEQIANERGEPTELSYPEKDALTAWCKVKHPKPETFRESVQNMLALPYIFLGIILFFGSLALLIREIGKLIFH